MQTTTNLYTTALRWGSAQFLRRNGVKIRDGSRNTELIKRTNTSDKTARFSASFAAPFLSDKEKREYNLTKK
ncbi:MAG: hypothetical protein IJW76_02860 [Clostridia bacterium]|nr:hypothetical protein [Clostridia bacterium]